MFLTICISSLEIIEFFACLLIGLFFFFCWVVQVFYTFWILHSYKTYDLQIFSLILWVVFSLSWEYPLMQTVLNFDEVQFIYFSPLVTYSFDVIFKKPLPDSNSYCLEEWGNAETMKRQSKNNGAMMGRILVPPWGIYITVWYKFLSSSTGPKAPT